MIVLEFFLAFLALLLALFLWVWWKMRLQRKGVNQLREKDFDAAIETFKKVLKMEPPHLNHYVNLSVALMGAERNAEALELMDDAIAAGLIAPPEQIETTDFLEATFVGNRGVALGKLDRFEEALACLETSLRNTPIEHPFYAFRLLNYARIYARQKQKQSALRVLEEIDRWFETHEMTNPQHIEVFEDDRKQVRDLVKEL